MAERWAFRSVGVDSILMAGLVVVFITMLGVVRGCRLVTAGPARPARPRDERCSGGDEVNAIVDGDMRITCELLSRGRGRWWSTGCGR